MQANAALNPRAAARVAHVSTAYEDEERKVNVLMVEFENALLAD